MTEPLFPDVIAGLKSGQTTPYIGPYALQDSVNKESSKGTPADSDSLILVTNDGQPMAPNVRLFKLLMTGITPPRNSVPISRRHINDDTLSHSSA